MFDLANFDVTVDNGKPITVRYTYSPPTAVPTFAFAENATEAMKSKINYVAVAGNESVNLPIYYAEGKLWTGHTAPARTKWEINLGSGSISNATMSKTGTLLVATGSAMETVTITPADGYSYTGVNISALTTALDGTGLTAAVQNDGTITISGTPSKDVDLSKVTWPTPTAMKTVNLGTLPTGLALASGSGALNQTVTSGGAIADVVLTVGDGYIATAEYINTLNGGILKDTGLTAALQKDGTIKISGTPSANVDLSTATWPAPTGVQATNGSKKYATVGEALTAAESGTVTITGTTVTPVDDGTLKENVTLQDKDNNTYLASGGNATIDVSADGEVSLSDGTLEVSASGSVTVENGGKSYPVSSTSEPKSAFTVSAVDATVAIAIANAGGKVTNGNGLTFTAGSAGSSFPLDGSELTSDGDAVTVSKNGSAEIVLNYDVTVTVPATGKNNTGDVTVTKGEPDGSAAKVTMSKKGDTFKIGDKTYTAGADDTVFAVKDDGTVELISGAISLADDESFTGEQCGLPIKNPADSGADSVTVANDATNKCDIVTVPMGGDGSVKIGGMTYANTSATEDLVLKVSKDGSISVAGGSLSITDGSSVVGGASGATILNPGLSGDDNVTVASDGKTKDTVTVPAGTDKKVSITKGDKTTEYTNGSDNDALVIDIDANGAASLSGGAVDLDPDEGILVNGATITNTDDENVLTVTKNADGTATITLPEGKSFTGKNAAEGSEDTVYTAKGGDATFTVDANGNIILSTGELDVTGGSSVKVSDLNGGAYTVTGEKNFTVSADGENAPEVTIPNKGEKVSNGNGLTFTAGGANSSFPLDGSKLNNDGDAVTVSEDGSAEIVLNYDVTVTVPASGTNAGDVTVTKGDPTLVKLEKKGDTFTVGGTTYTADADGAEFAISADGTVTKVEAKLFGADGTLKKYGSVSDMLNEAASGDTVSMVGNPEKAITDGTLKNGATLEDTTGTAYKANGKDASIDVATDGEVTLKNGELSVTPASEQTASVGVVKDNSGDSYTVSGEAAFTVSTGENGENASVKIPNKGEQVSNGEGLTFTAGAASSSFPLDGSKLNNNGDAVTVSKDGSANVEVSNNVTVKVPADGAANSGDVTVTKGEPSGFTGMVELGKENDSFQIGDKTYTAAADDTAFAFGPTGETTLIAGATEISEGSLPVRADGWKKSVSVTAPDGNSNNITVTAGSPSTAEVKAGDSVSIGGKTYKAVGKDTTFSFDEDGKVTLSGGKTELAKNEQITAGVSKAEIKNTSADSDAVVTVESDPTSGKDTVTVPKSGKVSIGGKEYTNADDSNPMTAEIDENGKVTLTGGVADFGKDTSLALNGAEMTNTGSSALTLTKNEDGTGMLEVAKDGSFTIGGKTEVSAPQDMPFTVDTDGNVIAELPNGDVSITVNGVTYTGGDAILTIDKNGNATVTGTYSMKVPGSSAPTFVISGKVEQANDGSAATVVSGATVTLTQGGKDAIQLASVKTDADGKYRFEGVPAGTYNIVVTNTTGGETKTMTKLIEITDGDVDVDTITLPAANVSSIVKVGEDSPVGAMVGGLDEIAANNEVAGKKVTVTLTVKAAEEDSAIAALEEAQGKTLLSLNLDLEKHVDGSKDNAFTNNKVLKIVLTFDTANKRDIVVLHNHNGTASALTKLEESPTGTYTEGTYFVGEGYIEVYTSKFSPYAIAYTPVSYGGAGSSGSGSSVNVGNTSHGSVSVGSGSANTGDTVTITVKPDEGYRLGTLTVKDSNGNVLTLTKISDTEYSFTKPDGDVTVTATFVLGDADFANCPKDKTCPICSFKDASATAWYHDGVHYSIATGLMEGYGNGKFGPNDATTRAQMVVMLWKLSGCPTVDQNPSFEDVSANDWFAQAIRWAAAEGIASGYGNGKFGPKDNLTREQMAVMLYHYAQYLGLNVTEDAKTSLTSFTDSKKVSDYAVTAMQWAYGADIINGEKHGNVVLLAPQGDASRAQIATIMMHFCVNVMK